LPLSRKTDTWLDIEAEMRNQNFEKRKQEQQDKNAFYKQIII